MVIQKSRGKVDFGTVYCRCDEFPILEGILYLKKERAKLIVASLQRGETRQALEHALGDPWILKLPGLSRILLSRKWAGKLNLAKVGRILPLLGRLKHLDYWLKRRKHKESLLLFFPLLVLGTPQREIVWLDVGSGFQAYQPEIARMKKITFIALEISFLRQLLTRYFSPNQATLICADIAVGSPVRNKTVRVVTLIDTLPFIANQKRTIELLAQPGFLKKGGLVFMSSVPEHVHLPLRNQVFPLNNRLLKEYFPTRPVILDEARLLEQLDRSVVNIGQAIMGQTPLRFRYAVLWPSSALVKKRFQNVIPQSIQGHAKTFWPGAPLRWHNKVY
jgi:hypothetical protein